MMMELNNLRTIEKIRVTDRLAERTLAVFLPDTHKTLI
jgi:hypothetical protein